MYVKGKKTQLDVLELHLHLAMKRNVGAGN